MPTSTNGPRVIRAHQERWEDTYVYFKHEDEGKGPELARQLMRPTRALRKSTTRRSAQ